MLKAEDEEEARQQGRTRRAAEGDVRHAVLEANPAVGEERRADPEPRPRR